MCLGFEPKMSLLENTKKCQPVELQDSWKNAYFVTKGTSYKITTKQDFTAHSKIKMQK